MRYLAVGIFFSAVISAVPNLTLLNEHNVLLFLFLMAFYQLDKELSRKTKTVTTKPKRPASYGRQKTYDFRDTPLRRKYQELGLDSPAIPSPERIIEVIREQNKEVETADNVNPMLILVSECMRVFTYAYLFVTTNDDAPCGLDYFLLVEIIFKLATCILFAVGKWEFDENMPRLVGTSVVGLAGGLLASIWQSDLVFNILYPSIIGQIIYIGAATCLMKRERSNSLLADVGAFLVGLLSFTIII